MVPEVVKILLPIRIRTLLKYTFMIFFKIYLTSCDASAKMTATAGIFRGVAKGGNVAIAVSPAGTRARVAAGAPLGEAPPPTDPGGVLPKNGLICINIFFHLSNSKMNFLISS